MKLMHSDKFFWEWQREGKGPVAKGVAKYPLKYGRLLTGFSSL